MQCGAGPFARVAKHWIVPANESHSANVTSKFRTSNFGRDVGSPPQVHMLQIDTNFNESASGCVNIYKITDGDLRLCTVVVLSNSPCQLRRILKFLFRRMQNRSANLFQRPRILFSTRASTCSMPLSHARQTKSQRSEFMSTRTSILPPCTHCK